MVRLRGVARKAAKVVPVLEAVTAVLRCKQTDESIRLVLLDWMDEMQSLDAKRLAGARASIAKERERQQRIADAKALRQYNHRRVEARRAATIKVREPFFVPPCLVIPHPVRCYGNRYGTGASYRIVDGVPQRID